MDILAEAASVASASVASESPDEHCFSPSSTAKPTTCHSKKGEPKLPQTLMKLLNDELYPEVLWWLPGHKEFAINSDLFPTKILNVYFPGSKYASFIRRLHKMGFSRQTRSLKKVYGKHIPEHAVAFRHERFQREHPEWLDELKNGYFKEQLKKVTKAKVTTSKTTTSKTTVKTTVKGGRKGLKARADVDSVASSVMDSPSVPGVVEAKLPMPILSLAPPLPEKPNAEAHANANANFLLHAQLLRQQANEELQRQEQERAVALHTQLLLHQQHQQQLHLQANEELQRQEQERQLTLLMLHQQQEQQQLEALYQRQLLAASLYQDEQARAYLAPPPPSAEEQDALLRLELLQRNQQEQQQQANANLYFSQFF